MATDDDFDRIEIEAADLRSQIARARAQLWGRVNQQRKDRRQYARDYYAKNREEYLEEQRRYRAAQRAKDPDAYRERARKRNQRWRDSHRDEVNEKIRNKYHLDPEKHRERRREYYAEHAEQQRARRREYYANNREKQNAAHRAWADRDKRRRAAGLPARQLHRPDRETRRANAAAADAFFARMWTKAELAEVRRSLATPPELWAAFKRESLKMRAAHHLMVQREVLERLQKELGRAKPGPKPKPRLTAEQIEEARLDAIGRQINDRLRQRQPPPRVQHVDPAVPHPMLRPNPTMGMDR